MPIKTYPTVLVVGGAGYIGSHMVDYLASSGYKPIVLDNLSTGHRDAVQNAAFFRGDLLNNKLLDELFVTYDFQAVMHFAAAIRVDESVSDPLKYYQNNVAQTINLLQMMKKHQVQSFVFSSTAAVYGEPQYCPIDEKHPIAPINPYGRSKQMIENILADVAATKAINYASLRYFNAAGADPEGRFAERHDPETHLIPLLLQAAQADSTFFINGNDYATADGTCIRDYIHVTDLCQAHLLAMEKLLKFDDSFTYNLGTGKGYSIKEVVEMAQKITGKKIQVAFKPRRAGDPAKLVADSQLAINQLAWEPEFSDLATIIEHTWQTLCQSFK